MKQGGLILAGFVLIFASMLPLAADSEVNYQTYMVDTFDTTEEWTWEAVGSKFVTEGYPVLKFFDGMPHAVRVMQSDPDAEYRFMGVQFKFNRQGDNWVDIVPMKDGKNYEIPLKGIVNRFDLWVWGAGYLYSMEMLVRDCNGRVHVLPLGPLNYQGWKNLAVKVPTNIPQASKYLSNVKYMSFVAFRIRTSPMERVDDFYIFIDQFKALTNVFVNSYDGFELEKANFQEENSNNEGESGK
ncbi:hypothetical protein DWQ65_01360 [Treponema phagedenis]|uniref:Flagellar filament outer layer protein FlaA n=1 Tax=Treponema phagedenis TaxID=162 RepID=A0A0B7GV46_TREPH|nr:flagellar filament outer layer protein FlaA [Treponema phagedenis]EFW38330.1 flagellar filament outer layer protein FlaA [Treponema phagedenis F0421]NVP25034.1 hypothetical protein [Treponema phagedenis]QEJ94052.1 hypothetical protein FUT79_01685 [Treponema phagedenis]QEJ97149.1 hypothetical protein FUT82_03550 [Treponema phagedenis]QEK01938.1 hypothetical protein FUT84_12725 [Treponema phagedenis]